MTLTSKLIEKLKDNWCSNYQLTIEFKSAGVPQLIRSFRQKPPIGYKLIDRWKETSKGYNRCKEFMLVKE